ncbi:hypothetical protein K438DRAFT_1888063 [Mycena galopus ATCC 62051]|nr:hypothetical protein K438DRAFT_1888063 [Mycena galopus ATCC 62051]
MRTVPASHDRARCGRRQHPASSWSCLCSSPLSIYMCADAAPLLPSGILRICHVNFDYVTPSSFNRHAMAALADVGTLIFVFAGALHRVRPAPNREVEARVHVWKHRFVYVLGFLHLRLS